MLVDESGRIEGYHLRHMVMRRADSDCLFGFLVGGFEVFCDRKGTRLSSVVRVAENFQKNILFMVLCFFGNLGSPSF